MASTPSFEVVIDSFLRPLDATNPDFKEYRVYQFRNGVSATYDSDSFRRGFMLSPGSQAELTLICPRSLESKDSSSIKDRLLLYLSSVHDHGFQDPVTTKPQTDISFGFEYKNYSNYAICTLTLPNPESASHIAFLQLVIISDNAIGDNNREKGIVVGLCLGIDCEMLDKALGFLEYTSLVEDHKKESQKMESDLKSESNLTVVDDQIGHLRSTLKSILKDRRTLRTNRENFMRHLHKTIENLVPEPRAWEPGESIPGSELDLRKKSRELEREFLTEVISFMKELEGTEDLAVRDMQELEEDAKYLIEQVWDLKKKRKERLDLEQVKMQAEQAHIQAQQAEMQYALMELTKALSADSANMKIIAILTAFFLPFTFMAILLTTQMFKWPEPSEGEIIMWLPFRIYWAASGGMTLFLGCWMIWVLRPKLLFQYNEWRRDRKRAKEESSF